MMTKTIATGRRDFIGKISVLSSCLLVGSPSSLFATQAKNADNLHELWNTFIALHNGKLIASAQSIDEALAAHCCAGQFYKAGDAFSFGNTNIIGQPTWIYWGEQRITPNDMVVSFFNDGQKLCRLNAFELETMVASSKAKPQPLHELLSLVKTDLSLPSSKENSPGIQTIIAPNKLAKSRLHTGGHAINLNSRIFYNI